MEVYITTATESDVSLLTSLGRITFEQTFAHDNTAADMQLYLMQNFNESQILDEIHDPASTFIVAYVDQEPAGYAKMRENALPPGVSPSKALEIERIYAKQEFIGKKIGKALMEYCMKYARNEQYEMIWLGVWEKNVRAIHFYERWGFTVFGSHLFMLGTDAQTDLLMVKKIE
ncbi:MAG TPA: GNAT family N-acetyltransferase [Flavitalea sp.]|nr:GNAT family N-acetyltransferase [Flavitalea sp.]